MFDEAISEYEAALAIDPYHVEALSSAAALYLQDGQRKRAIVCYKRALLLSPDDTGVWTRLAAAYEQIGDYEKAERTYRQTLVRDPYGEDANIGFARTQYLRRKSLGQSDNEDILRRLDFVLSVNPSNQKAEDLRRRLTAQGQ